VLRSATAQVIPVHSGEMTAGCQQLLERVLYGIARQLFEEQARRKALRCSSRMGVLGPCVASMVAPSPL